MYSGLGYKYYICFSTLIEKVNKKDTSKSKRQHLSTREPTTISRI